MITFAPMSIKMNRIFVSSRKVFFAAIVMIATSFCETNSYAQVVVVDTVIDRIAGTIAEGNADSLATFLNKRVELSLPNYAAISSRDQARMILRKFFMIHQPDSFAVAGENQYPGGFFVIGTLNSGDHRYRVSFLTKQELSQQSVYQISIEE